MAIQKITASVLGNNAVTAANVAAGALSAADIADNSLTAAKLSTSTFAIDSLTVNTSDLVVDTANNRVGIGTSSPSQILHVKSASPNILLEGTNFPAVKWAGTDLTIDAEIYYGIGANDLNINNYNSGIIAFKTNNLERMRIDSSGQVYIGTDDNAGFDGTQGLAIATNNPGLSFKPQNSGWTGDDWLIYVNTTDDFFGIWNSTDGSNALKIDGNNLVTVPTEFRTTLFTAYTSTGRYAKYRSAYGQAAIADFEVKSDNNSADVVNFYGTGSADVLVLKNSGTNQLRVDSTSGTISTYLGTFAGGTYFSNNYYYYAGHNSNDATKGSAEMFMDEDKIQFNFMAAGSPGTRSRKLTLLDSGEIGIGETVPDSKLHIKGTGQLNLLKIERASSTPGITFVNGADTAGTFGFQLMDNDEYWAGAYDGTNYNYWFKGNSSVFRVEKPVASTTDSGTRQYSHLCTGSFYSGTGAIVINTNIPAHNASGNANMFSIKIRGFQYSDGGQIDMNVGCYAGENNYYSATYGGAHVPYQWVDEVHFAENTSTNTVAIILGTTSSGTNYEIAVVDFIQGFINVNESYAAGWTMTRTTDLSGYGSITDCAPKRTVPVEGFHAYLSSSASLGNGVVNLSSTGLTASYNRGNRFNASNGRFTASQDGVYHFDMQVQLGSSTTALSYLSAEVRVNGGTRYIGGWFGNLATGTSYKAASGSVTIPLDSGDYVEFLSEISASHSYLGNNAGYTYISGIKIA